jgi:phage gpG-like protein
MVPRSKVFKVELPDVSFYMEFNFSYREFEEKMAGKMFMDIFLNKAYFEILTRIRRRFKTETGPDRKKWKKLSPTTLISKKGAKPGFLAPHKTGIGEHGRASAFRFSEKILRSGWGKMLKFTGNLQNSLQKRITRNEVTVYTTIPYAKYHQWGAKYVTKPKQSFWLWNNMFQRKGHPFAKRKITIPPRPFMGFTDTDIQYLRNLMVKELKKAERLGTYIP